MFVWSKVDVINNYLMPHTLTRIMLKMAFRIHGLSICRYIDCSLKDYSSHPPYLPKIVRSNRQLDHEQLERGKIPKVTNRLKRTQKRITDKEITLV